MKHELWLESESEQTFCLAGPRGDAARALLAPASILIWEVEASNHFEAMTKYHRHMGWADYTTEFSGHDKQTYRGRGWDDV